jgi:hypothetical protein
MNFRNSNKQGDAGVGAAIAWFTSQGHSVSVPIRDSQEYDLIVDIDGILNRVQVKTTSHKRDDNFRVELRTKGGNKSGTGKTKKLNEGIDILFVMTSDGDLFLIQSKYIKGRSTLVLGDAAQIHKIITKR